MGAPFFGLRIVFENIAGLAYVVRFCKKLMVRGPLGTGRKWEKGLQTVAGWRPHPAGKQLKSK